MRTPSLAAIALLFTPAIVAAAEAPPTFYADRLVHQADHQFECGQVRDPDLAIEGCKALIAANPEDGEAHLALGLAYERIGAGADALDAFTDATGIGRKRIETNDRDGDAWLLIALASRGAARIAKDEPDMRKDFEEEAKAATDRALALGVRVPQID